MSSNKHVTDQCSESTHRTASTTACVHQRRDQPRNSMSNRFLNASHVMLQGSSGVRVVCNATFFKTTIQVCAINVQLRSLEKASCTLCFLLCTNLYDDIHLQLFLLLIKQTLHLKNNLHIVL